MFNSTITGGLDLAPVVASISPHVHFGFRKLRFDCPALPRATKKRSPNLQKHTNTRFKIFRVKLLCGYDPKNITLYLYLLSAGAKKQPLSFRARLIFHQRYFYVLLHKSAYSQIISPLVLIHKIMLTTK